MTIQLFLFRAKFTTMFSIQLILLAEFAHVHKDSLVVCASIKYRFFSTCPSICLICPKWTERRGVLLLGCSMENRICKIRLSTNRTWREEIIQLLNYHLTTTCKSYCWCWWEQEDAKRRQRNDWHAAHFSFSTSRRTDSRSCSVPLWSPSKECYSQRRSQTET